uniref:Uncharacterized protein n=1 Tax=Mastacembelus armatus TaxID=205130 RepID=A0A3Q3L7W5_9TELE
MTVWVFSGYSGFLPQSKDMQVGFRLIGDSELPVGVSVSVCLSLCVSSVPRLSPGASWDWLQSLPLRPWKKINGCLRQAVLFFFFFQLCRVVLFFVFFIA